MLSDTASVQQANASRRRRQRRTLSCLPCRLSKLRCDRATPCQMCIRHSREHRCRANPPSASDVTVTRNPRLKDLAPTGVTSEAEIEDQSPFTPASPSEHDRPRDIDVSVAGNISVASAVASRTRDARDKTLFDEPISYWKRHLVSILPSQSQCDMLVSYFLENINWIYQAIHAPSLRQQHATIWASDVDELELDCLALLYIILCLGAVYIPSQMAEAVGFETSQLPVLHRRWYAASRQALHVGGYDSKPTLIQLQVFLLSQLYWYATKNIEALNSHMGQALRNAQAIGLDREAPRSLNCLEREMRHRVWWDLVSSDTFQSLCLGRPALLQAHTSSVPFPSNCNDEDMSATAVNPRPITEPTHFSVHLFRAQLFKILSQLYVDNGAHLSSYQFVDQVDRKLSNVLTSVPWYLTDDLDSLRRRLPSRLATTLSWQRHILHSSISTQRVRMYRPFLHPLQGDAWQQCVEASTGTLSVYKTLRSRDIAHFQRSQKMHVQAYQVFSAAVALATFLLVEMPSNAGVLRADIELVLEDLDSYSCTLDKKRRMSLVSDGQKVIHRILALYDARRRLQSRTSQVGDGNGDLQKVSQTGDTPEALVPAIYSVFGGESTARRYLERCAIDYILNEPTGNALPGPGLQNQSSEMLEASSVGEMFLTTDDLSSDGTDMPLWNGLFDSSNWGQWGELLLADLDTFLATGTESA
ncbi:hypothetical protein CC79DRAFT_1360159 [Sarocladium strictum]